MAILMFYQYISNIYSSQNPLVVISEVFKRPDVKENFATSEEIFTLGCLNY